MSKHDLQRVNEDRAICVKTAERALRASSQLLHYFSSTRIVVTHQVKKHLANDNCVLWELSRETWGENYPFVPQCKNHESRAIGKRHASVIWRLLPLRDGGVEMNPGGTGGES